MDIEDFIKEAKETGSEHYWAVSIPPDSTDHILYYPMGSPSSTPLPSCSSPVRCPYLLIHKRRIKRIDKICRVDNCFPVQGPPPFPVWIAHVVLHPPHDDSDRELHGALDTLAELSRPSSIAVKDEYDKASILESGRLAYSVGPGRSSTRTWSARSMNIWFSTRKPEGGTDFYLHVEGERNSRYRVFQGQAQVFADGSSGLGPYNLSDDHVRKIHITNGVSGGTVDVLAYIG